MKTWTNAISFTSSKNSKNLNLLNAPFDLVIPVLYSSKLFKVHLSSLLVLIRD